MDFLCTGNGKKQHWELLNLRNTEAKANVFHYLPSCYCSCLTYSANKMAEHKHTSNRRKMKTRAASNMITESHQGPWSTDSTNAEQRNIRKALSMNDCVFSEEQFLKNIPQSQPAFGLNPTSPPPHPCPPPPRLHQNFHVRNGGSCSPADVDESGSSAVFVPGPFSPPDLLVGASSGTPASSSVPSR